MELGRAGDRRGGADGEGGGVGGGAHDAEGGIRSGVDVVDVGPQSRPGQDAVDGREGEPRTLIIGNRPAGRLPQFGHTQTHLEQDENDDQQDGGRHQDLHQSEATCVTPPTPRDRTLHGHEMPCAYQPLGTLVRLPSRRAMTNVRVVTRESVAATAVGST